MASIRANYIKTRRNAAPSSKMTASACFRHMDTMAQILVVNTWSDELGSFWDGDRWGGRRQGHSMERDHENIITRERLNEFERGLGAAYDTEAHQVFVQNMLQIFPNSIRNWPYDNYSVCFCVTDPRLVSFLPVMLQACIDQGKTIEETRNILISSHSYDGQNIITGLFTVSRQIEPLYDARCTTVLRQLTHMNLLQKEDVQQYALLDKLLQGSCPMVDQRQRFDFLVQLDPYALITQSDPDGLLKELKNERLMTFLRLTKSGCMIYLYLRVLLHPSRLLYCKFRNRL